MLHEVLVWHVFVLILFQDFSDEDANPHTAFDLGHPKADTLTGPDWYGVIRQGKPLVAGGMFCLGCISSSHMDTFSFEVRTVDNKMFEFQYLIDIVIDFINSFDVTGLRMI